MREVEVDGVLGCHVPLTSGDVILPKLTWGAASCDEDWRCRILTRSQGWVFEKGGDGDEELRVEYGDRCECVPDRPNGGGRFYWVLMYDKYL